MFFEFHPSYCVIKDIQTQEILLQGQVCDGLYQFLADSSIFSNTIPSINNPGIQDCHLDDDVFTLAGGEDVARHASVQVLSHRGVLRLGLPSDIDLVVDWHGADGGLAAAEDHSRALTACQIASHIATW